MHHVASLWIIPTFLKKVFLPCSHNLTATLVVWYKPLPLSAKWPAAITTWVDTANSCWEALMDHDTQKYLGGVSITHLKIYVTKASFILCEKLSQHLVWGRSRETKCLSDHKVSSVSRTGGLTEGAITVRPVGSIFLFPERFLQNCTHSTCGLRLPAESSTCKTLPWLTPGSQQAGCEGSPVIWGKHLRD